MTEYVGSVRELLSGLDPLRGHMDPELHQAALGLGDLCEREAERFRALTELEGYAFSNELAGASMQPLKEVMDYGYGNSSQDGWHVVDVARQIGRSCREDLAGLAVLGEHAGFVSRLEDAEGTAARFLDSARGGLGFVSREGYEPPADFSSGASFRDFGEGCRQYSSAVLEYTGSVRELLSGLDPLQGHMDPELHRAALGLADSCEQLAGRIGRGEWTDHELEADWRQEQTLEALGMDVRALGYLMKPRV